MSFTYEQRAPDSPYVRTIWRTRNLGDGVYVASADGCWDIIISKQADASYGSATDVTEVRVCGPASRAVNVEYSEGTEALGIRFRVGTFLPHLPAGSLLDLSHVLPQASSKSFWLYGSAWEIPTFENVETFIDRLV